MLLKEPLGGVFCATLGAEVGCNKEVEALLLPEGVVAGAEVEEAVLPVNGAGALDAENDELVNDEELFVGDPEFNYEVVAGAPVELVEGVVAGADTGSVLAA